MKQFFTFMTLILLAFGLNAQYIYNDYDANQNEVFLAWPNMPVTIANPYVSGINTSANVAQWDRSNWAQWDNVYTELSGKIDFTTGTIFSVKVYSPIACNVLFKLEDKANGGIFTERTLPIATPNQWVQLNFDFSGEPSGTFDKIVFFLDFSTFNANTFYFDDIEGPYYAGSQGKPLNADDVQDNFENNGWGNITSWIFQDPGLNPLTITSDPVNSTNNVADYNRSGGFEWTNAQAELDHRMDLTNRNVFEMDVYFPSSNDYTGLLTNTVDIKLQNSLLGGNAWTTEAVVSHSVNTYDQWVTLSFDFSRWATTEEYDKIVVQFGGQGHWVSGQFYFDNIELIPWYPTPEFTYNNFDDTQNVAYQGWPNMPTIVANPNPSGINNSAQVAEWIRSSEQWANSFMVLDGPVNFTNGTNFQLKVLSPIVCNVLLKLENQNNGALFVEQTSTIWNVNEWTLLNFDFPGAASETYDKITIFFDFSSVNDNTFYVDDIVGPAYDEPKPVLATDVQDNFENDGWSTIDEWIFQNPNMDPLATITDPVNSNNTVADYNRNGAFEYANAQTILDHRLDLSERNKFELKVFFPSSNNYTGALTPTASLKLQNSLLGGNAWTTQAEIVQTITVFDEWVTLTYDFSAWSENIDYDQIVVQLGGEGHWAPGQFYFDDLYLLHVPYVAVLSPNGGEMIDQGSQFDIEWDYDYWTGSVTIELIKGNEDPQLIGYNVSASDTLFTWGVFPNQEPGSDYRIIITSTDNSFPTDTSDAYFTIVAVTTIQSNFAANQTTLAEGDSVLFTDMSTGSPISWEWTFEGGTPSSFSGQQPPEIIYETAGVYQVTLIVDNGTESDTLTKEDYITVGVVPAADFVANQTVLLAGLPVDFTSLSIGSGLTYNWYFEGGTPETSSEEMPTGIVFYEAGFFDVQLIVSNEFGADTLLKPDYIEAQPEAVNSLDQISFVVFPNPVVDLLHIQMENNTPWTVNLINFTGKVVSQKKVSTNMLIMDVSHLNSGIYILKVKSDSSSQILTMKIIIL